MLVSCCGLPAAGKTSFCRSIVNCGAPLHQSPSPSTPSYGVHVTHICFDKYIDLALQRARQPQHSPAQRRAVGPKIGGLPDKAENSNTGEKQPDEVARDPQYSTRRDGSTLHCDNNNGAVDEIQEREEEAAWWHEGRRDAMAAVEALAARNPALAAAVVQGQEVREEAQTNGNDTTRTGPCGWGSAKEEYVRCEENEQSVFVVLVDDNMHFRSMRHEVLRLARECERGRCALSMLCSAQALSTAFFSFDSILQFFGNKLDQRVPFRDIEAPSARPRVVVTSSEFIQDV